MQADKQNNLCIFLSRPNIHAQSSEEQQRLEAEANFFLEDLGLSFSKLNGFNVRLRNSNLDSTDPNEKLCEEGTNYQINTGIRSIQKGFKISVQLIRLEDYQIIYAERYSRLFSDTETNQNLVVEQVVNVFQCRMKTDIIANALNKEAETMAVHEKCLRGMDLVRKGREQTNEEAKILFKDAIAINPKSAEAYTGLALAELKTWNYRIPQAWKKHKIQIYDYVNKAIEINSDAYIAIRILGQVYFLDGEKDKARFFLNRSKQLNPNDADNLAEIAYYLALLGQTDEAKEILNKAMKINPLHGQNYFSYELLVQLEAQAYERAIEASQKLNLNHLATIFIPYIAAAYHYKGLAEAREKYWRLYLNRVSSHYKQENHLAWLFKMAGSSRKNKFVHFLLNYTQEDALFNEKKIQTPKVQNQFIRKGQFWNLNYEGNQTFLRDSKGLHNIAQLIKQVNERIFCVELMGGQIYESSAIKAFDQKAKLTYHKKLRDIQEDIEEAERLSNSTQLEKLYKEYDDLVVYLTRSMGLGQKARKINNSIDKARSAVTWRIRNVIKKMEKEHEALARHLKNSIKTGTFCSYMPEKLTIWELV